MVRWVGGWAKSGIVHGWLGGPSVIVFIENCMPNSIKITWSPAMCTVRQTYGWARETQHLTGPNRYTYT